MPRHRRGWAMGGGFHARHSPMIVSMLEPLLLVLLSENPSHGYTLLAELETLGIDTIHHSVVYRTLRELEKLGWVQSYWDTGQTQGPPRRNYSLTNQGRDALKNWQSELVKVRELISCLLDRLSKPERS